MKLSVPWNRQPQTPALVDWSNPINKGLVFCAPLSPASGLFDIALGQKPTRTGMVTPASTENGLYYNFGTSNYVDYPIVPKAITTTTPCSIAWTQEPRSPSSYSTILHANFGSGTSAFIIYEGSDSSYQMAIGPRSGGFVAVFSTGIPVNNQLDKFCLLMSAGPNSSDRATFRLFRNGVEISQTAPQVFGGYTGATMRIGAREGGADPFEGIIGNLHIWSRVLTDTEAKQWCANEFMTLAPIRSVPLFNTIAAAPSTFTPKVFMY